MHTQQQATVNRAAAVCETAGSASITCQSVRHTATGGAHYFVHVCPEIGKHNAVATQCHSYSSLKAMHIHRCLALYFAEIK